MSVPVVTIFVRHSTDCKHKGDEFHKQCRCRKHLRWSSGGKQYRQSAQTRSWEQAEKRKKVIELQFDSGATPEQAAAAALPASRKTLGQAIKTFISGKENQNIDSMTLNNHKRDLRRLEEFMSKKGRFFPAEVTLDDLESFRASWKDYYKASSSRSVAQTRLTEFLTYCYNDRMIDRIPALTPIETDHIPTLPLTDAQVETLLNAIPTAFPKPVPAVKIRERVRALILLQLHSGLSIHDAVTLERDRIDFNPEKKLYRVLTSRQKTGTDVYVPLPTEVAEHIFQVHNSEPRYLFWHGDGDAKTYVHGWSGTMRKLFGTAFPIPKNHPKYCKCHPRGSHQLRDTFAVNMLVKGVDLVDVSKMLGHTSIKTTEKHYSAWVQARQDRLDTIVASTWQAAAAAL